MQECSVDFIVGDQQIRGGREECKVLYFCERRGEVEEEVKFL